MIKVAVIKPDHGPVGGFERVVDRVEQILGDASYDVTRYTVDLTDTDAVARSRHLENMIADTQREFLTYLHGRDRCDGISTSAYDLVISTSPPSYGHRHPAHLSLFFHHHRIFYDLEQPYVDAGFALDPATHAHAAWLVRSLDRERLEAVTTFLCPSRTVADRLEHFNARRDTLPFHAGVGVASGVVERGDVGTGALCVTRHEFPKRVELVVAAAHLIDDAIPVTCPGTGGRLAFAEQLDARLATDDLDASSVDALELWCNTGALAVTTPTTRSPGPSVPGGRVEFLGHVEDRRIDALYAAARCVVAPAYDEDYGLTAIEAMRHGCPVIVCRDGGGLTEFVDDGVTGLVVEPTPTAIAAAIEKLHADEDLARALGRNGFEFAAGLTWSKAADQLLLGVERTLDHAA